MGLSNEMAVGAVFLVFVIIWAGYYFLKGCLGGDDIQYPWPVHGGCGDVIAEEYKNQRAREILDATKMGRPVGIWQEEALRENDRIDIELMSKEEVLDKIVKAGEILDAQPVPKDWPGGKHSGHGRCGGHK